MRCALWSWAASPLPEPATPPDSTHRMCIASIGLVWSTGGPRRQRVVQGGHGGLYQLLLLDFGELAILVKLFEHDQPLF